MKHQTGFFATPHALKYLQQLAKHFAHKVDVTMDDTECEVSFPFGPAKLSANPGELRVRLSGETDEALSTGRMVMDSHLKRFAFREAFEQMAWHEPSATSQ
jgi:hypothetical protein